MKKLIFYLFFIRFVIGQSSIEIPIGASLTLPNNSYISMDILTVNGEIKYDASSLSTQPNSHLIASIIESSALNEDGYFKVGDTVSVTVTFSQNVVVSGIPQLTLETGNSNQVINYVSGDQTLTLTFNYIVEMGDMTPDLEYISTTALSLNGGTIKNFFDKDADLLLPEPGMPNSLSSNKDIYIDGIIPINGELFDGLNEDLNYSNSLTDLSFNWIDFRDENSSGIDRYYIGLGTTPGGFELKNFEDVGSKTSHTFTGLNLVNGNTYYGIVKAEDKAGNVSTESVSDGITIDEFGGPPVIEFITPNENNNLNLNDESIINIDFTEPLSTVSIDIVSNINTINYSYELSSKYLTINILSSLASRDELSIQIYDYKDFAGISGTSQTIKFNTATLADLNQDSDVNAVDLSLFVEAWNNNDFSRELGPSIGTVPNLILSPDNKYDLEDVMGFSRMWHWSRKNSVSGKQLAQVGDSLDYSQVESTIIIDWDKNASVAQFDFIYDPQFIRIKNSNQINDENMELSYFDTLNGQNVFAYANLSDEKYINKKYSTEVIGKESHSIDLSYQFFTDKGQLISQGTESILIKPIPLEFALHQNYPNPFNPITTINYDLPQQSHVNIMIYDILGREVAKLVNSEVPAGYQSVIWNTRNNFGTPVSAGIYFYQIQTKDFVKTKKMVLLK